MIIQENISRQLVFFSYHNKNCRDNTDNTVNSCYLHGDAIYAMVVPVGNSSFWEKLVDNGCRLYIFNYIGG